MVNLERISGVYFQQPLEFAKYTGVFCQAGNIMSRNPHPFSANRLFRMQNAKIPGPQKGPGIFRFGRAALYTNTLPPINSRMMELFTMMLSSSMTLKYFRNFSMRCASIYSGSSCPISAKSGAAYFFSTANS